MRLDDTFGRSWEGLRSWGLRESGGRGRWRRRREGRGLVLWGSMGTRTVGLKREWGGRVEMMRYDGESIELGSDTMCAGL